MAIAICIVLGLLLLLCLLFEQTKPRFQRWLFYGIGTLFSMAALAAMTGIALEMVLRVSKAFWLESIGAKLILGPAFENGLSNHAMRQGVLGLIVTTRILTRPNGCNILPGHAGHLRGIFADWRRRVGHAEC